LRIKQQLKFTNNIDLKISLLRISIGIIYVWFGALKFFPHMSPAESIAQDTIAFLTVDLIPIDVGYLMLAIWEIGLGVLLVFNFFRRTAVLIALTHMVLTFIPLFVFTSSSFETPPYAFTLLGQYILKNIIIICALFIIFPSKSAEKRLF